MSTHSFRPPFPADSSAAPSSSVYPVDGRTTLEGFEPQRYFGPASPRPQESPTAHPFDQPSSHGAAIPSYGIHPADEWQAHRGNDTAQPRQPPELDDRTVYHLADRRREAITRLSAMNFEHARAAWQLRRSDPIEPYGLALLFAQADERPWRTDRDRVTAATRLWLAGTGSKNLPDHLRLYATGLSTRLAHLADIRQEANRRDPEMSERAEYIGIGVSSLDTNAGPWAQAVKQLAGDTDVAPGQVWIVLTDGTVMVVERGGTAAFSQQTVYTTDTLDYGPGNPPYAYRPTTAETLHTNLLHHHVLHWLTEINSMFWHTDWDRTAARGGTR